MSEHGGDGPETAASGQLEAVLFDMDGVVTDTAQAHAAAWQRLFDDYLQKRADERGEAFQPFDPAADYLAHVDGKPRYDGVRDFLASRGIELPYGSEDDDPDQETICGLGNRKNRCFNAWLENHRVGIFPGTIALIRELRANGVRTAVFSSSRNAEAVLKSAGVLDLFDAKVDGSDMAALGLPGKPEPAIMEQATRRLGARRDHTAVVEDAISGVQAGARGGFPLVIGVDRGGNAAALEANGAHLVVRDLAELRFDPQHGFVVKRLDEFASASTREGSCGNI